MPTFVTQSLETLLLALHFLCVDVAMIGPLGAILLARRGRRRGDPLAAASSRWLVRLAPSALAAAIVLGLCLGVLLWATGGGGRFFTGLMRLPTSRLYFSALELVFYLVLVVPCAVWWDRLDRWSAWRAVLLLAASTNLIYHFPGLFVSAAELATAPSDPMITSAEFRAMMFTAPVLAQVAHHVLSAITVVGVAIMVIASKPDPASLAPEPIPAQPLAVHGARVAMMATLLQVPVGLWLITTLTHSARSSVLGNDLLTTGLFLAAMVVALGLLHYLSTAALGEVDRRQSWTTLVMLALVILLMTGTLRQIRKHGYSAAASAPSAATR
jgi:hypothetical protein